MNQNLSISSKNYQNTSKNAVPTAKGLELGRSWSTDIWEIKNIYSMMSVMDPELRKYFTFRREEIMAEVLTLETGYYRHAEKAVKERLWSIYDNYPSALLQATSQNLSMNICLEDKLISWLKDVKFCAYLIVPPPTAADKVATALVKALEKVHEILDKALIVDSAGDYNNQAANTVLKAAKFLDDRAKGRPGKTVNVVDNRQILQQPAPEESLESIENAIIELEGKTKIVDEIDEAEIIGETKGN